jgi:hypothetical protein
MVYRGNNLFHSDLSNNSVEKTLKFSARGVLSVNPELFDGVGRDKRKAWNCDLMEKG